MKCTKSVALRVYVALQIFLHSHAHWRAGHPEHPLQCLAQIRRGLSRTSEISTSGHLLYVPTSVSLLSPSSRTFPFPLSLFCFFVSCLCFLFFPVGWIHGSSQGPPPKTQRRDLAAMNSSLLTNRMETFVTTMIPWSLAHE